MSLPYENATSGDKAIGEMQKILRAFGCQKFGYMIDRAPSGHRCGQSHPRARLTDDQVREMRQLHQQRGKGYFLLGIIFGCSEWTARDICTYRTRRNACRL